MQNAAVITPDLIPPRDVVTGELARPTGTTHGSLIVYEAHFLDHEKTYHEDNRVAVIDRKTGKQMTRKGEDGHYPIYRFPMRFTKRPFVLERSPQGEVRMNFHFRPTAEEVEGRRQATLTGEFGQRLAQEAVKRGLTPEQLIASLIDDVQDKVEADTAADPGRPALVEVSRGWWQVHVDGQNMNPDGKNLRKPEAEQLAASLVNTFTSPDEPDQSY